MIFSTELQRRLSARGNPLSEAEPLQPYENIRNINHLDRSRLLPICGCVGNVYRDDTSVLLNVTSISSASLVRASKQTLYLPPHPPKKNKFTIQDFNVKHRAGCQKAGRAISAGRLHLSNN